MRNLCVMHNTMIRISVIVLTVLMFMTSCSTSRQGTRAHKKPKSNSATVHYPHHRTDNNQNLLLLEADTWIGTPYMYGGEQKGDGADCSGLVMMVYLNALEMKLPRNSAKQAEFCDIIEERDVKIGDLVFFATGRDPEKVSHVGMIVDEEGTFIHASTKRGVCYSKITDAYYAKRFLMYGRVPGLKK